MTTLSRNTPETTRAAQLAGWRLSNPRLAGREKPEEQCILYQIVPPIARFFVNLIAKGPCQPGAIATAALAKVRKL